MSILTVQNVNKRFGGLKALNEVNLQVDQAAQFMPSSARTGPESRPC